MAPRYAKLSAMSLIGQPAPSFSLRDQSREVITLDDLKGRKSLVVFIPFPFTGVCHGELCAIRDNLAALNEFEAGVIVITCDTLAVNKKWSEENGFDFPVLSDFWPHGQTAIAYGAFDDRTGGAKRYTFVLDEDGVVRNEIKSEELGTPREFDLYLEALSTV